MRDDDDDDDDHDDDDDIRWLTERRLDALFQRLKEGLVRFLGG